MLLAVRLKWRESVVLLGFDLSVKLSRSVRFVMLIFRLYGAGSS